MQAVILAGGKGTRLKEEWADLPKPMVPIAGKPLLERQVELAIRFGFREVLFLTGYRAEVIEEHFGDGSRWEASFSYLSEEVPLGTAGAVLAAWEVLKDRFLVLYGDTLLDVDLTRLWATRLDGDPGASLFLHPNDHPYDSDLVELDDDARIRAFHLCPHQEGVYRANLVNAALYVIDRQALAPWRSLTEKMDFAKDLFPAMLARGVPLHGYVSVEYIKDVGTPDRLRGAEEDMISGRVDSRSLRQRRSAIFLDRDGVLNEERNRVCRPEELVLLAGAGDAVALINRSPYLNIVITNQPVVARGDCTEKELDRIHNKLEALLGLKGAYLDRIYHCPHHPDRGFPGERPELKIPCNCRKPKTGLLQCAEGDLFLDFSKSWFIGDSTRDLLCAHRAGVRAVLVRTGHGGRDGVCAVEPDCVFEDLGEAVDFILSSYPLLRERALDIAGLVVPGNLLWLGGAARSGKTTFAFVLLEALREKGMEADILSLDGWILPPEKRSEKGTVRDRFDYEGFRRFLDSLREANGTSFAVPQYDRHAQRTQIGEHRLSWSDKTVLLVEGVPAVDLAFQCPWPGLRIHIEVEEKVRWARFLRDYERRGLSPKEVERLWNRREVDENVLVRAWGEDADIRIRV